MLKTPTYLIYNGEGSSVNSVTDLEALCRISITGANVYKSDFACNFNGLDARQNPVVVLPGGAATTVGNKVKSTTNLTKWVEDMGWGYFGVCAGAYAAVFQAELYSCSHRIINGSLELPEYGYNTQDYQADLALCRRNAIGPFYPNDSYLNNRNRALYMPYCINVIINGISYPQLYVGGCGFKVAWSASEPTKDVGVYGDRNQYTFFKRGHRVTHNSLAAIVQRKRHGTRGPLLLSGVHLEAGVPNSRLLAAFRSNNPSEYCVALSSKDYAELQQARPKNLEMAKDLLRNTFGK